MSKPKKLDPVFVIVFSAMALGSLGMFYLAVFGGQKLFP